jgi:RES domain-containing protein
MPEAWRIVKEKHAATAFSGRGSADFGGRWNSCGVAVVYTSATKSLAALEILVHLNPPLAFKYVAIPVQIDDALVEYLPANGLPQDWQTEPPPPSTKNIGDGWVRKGRSVVLGVPSIIVSGEHNYLLNPLHPDFKRIAIGNPEPFAFDSRLLKPGVPAR